MKSGTTSEKTKEVYFPGLNGLRFFAALSVVITHVEMLKGQVGLKNSWTNPLLFNLGGLGVYFFFVLSGFLITYLLLKEKSVTGTISVKQFYLRRILRIWPLYYLIVILAFFIFPHIGILRLDWFQQFMPEHFSLKLLLYIFLLPNLALALFPRQSIPHAGHLWSIGVEEQFYLIWPWIIKKAGRALRVISFIGVGIVIFKAIVWIICKLYPGVEALEVLKSFVAMTKVECMAIGGAGACIVFDPARAKFLQSIFHPALQLAAYLIIPVLIYFTPDAVQDGVHLVYSFAFIVIIINVAVNKQSFLKLENKIFSFLGNISYGIYMYHMFIIVFVVRFVNSHFEGGNVMHNVLYYALSIIVTVLIAGVSHYLYEKPFIALKRKFSVVKSGDQKL